MAKERVADDQLEFLAGTDVDDAIDDLLSHAKLYGPCWGSFNGIRLEASSDDTEETMRQKWVAGRIAAAEAFWKSPEGAAEARRGATEILRKVLPEARASIVRYLIGRFDIKL